MLLHIIMSNSERSEMLEVARYYFNCCWLYKRGIAVPRGHFCEDADRYIKLFRSFIKEMEAGWSISASIAESACDYILEKRLEIKDEGASLTATYSEIAATVRHRAINARAAALAAGKG